MTTRLEREHIKYVKKALKELAESSRENERVCTDPSDNSYYEGLATAYELASELVRKMK